MLNTPVLIIGCGPIGLAGALLLSKFGIKSLIIEKRDSVNTHPRSRFVDTNTMELMRFLGVEKEVEDTGLGPDWTEYNRWFDALTKRELAAIPSPTFHTVPRDTSPTMPVMTCQDYVENVLHGLVREDTNITTRFKCEVIGLSQDDTGTEARVKDLKSGAEFEVQAHYAIGSDGPHSFARIVIGSELETEPRGHYSQDVIFEADLEQYVQGRKGGLLYNATANGVLTFQPLNGSTRWRCQIFKPDPDMLSNEETIERIREAVGSDDEIPISITSTGMWQPTPGCVNQMSQGRIFLAGDAAHVTLPTGGMGNNMGFAGIRNLAWKLAYVLKGHAPDDILSSYEIEHRPLALQRIATGVQTTEYMGKIFGPYYFGGDMTEGIRLTHQYADHDGVLLGFELASELIAKNHAPPPPVDDPVKEFVPAIRCGRRAPHVWVDEAKGQSVLDWFGLDYVLVAGASVPLARWREAAAKIEFPLRVEQLPIEGVEPYDADALVLVRPDGIIADCWSNADINADELEKRLGAMLPLY